MITVAIVRAGAERGQPAGMPAAPRRAPYSRTAFPRSDAVELVLVEAAIMVSIADLNLLAIEAVRAMTYRSRTTHELASRRVDLLVVEDLQR